MLLTALVAACCGVSGGKSNKPLPTPPRAFSVVIETTAHQLNATSDYPPYKRYMTVHYDHPARRVRIDYDPVPHMPPKSFVRRYDLDFEWMVMEVNGANKECQKSRMREAMPYARFPEKLMYVGQANVRGMACDHWREDLGEETVEYFETSNTHVPVRLTTIAIEEPDGDGEERKSTPLMTYDFSRFEARAPDESLFRMASSSASSIFSAGSPMTIDQCERVVQDVSTLRPPSGSGLEQRTPLPMVCVLFCVDLADPRLVCSRSPLLHACTDGLSIHSFLSHLDVRMTTYCAC